MASSGTGTGTSCVRLRGLPFTATDQEVAQWFAAAPGAPIQVHRVLFTYNTTGRKSGEAVSDSAHGLPARSPGSARMICLSCEAAAACLANAAAGHLHALHAHPVTIDACACPLLRSTWSCPS